MSIPSTQKKPFALSTLFVWVCLFSLPFLAYLVLPAFGVNTFTEMLPFKKIVLLIGAGMGLVAYWQYWGFIIQRPQLLTGFILLAWPIVDFLNLQLLNAGINIHLRPLLILSIMLPILWLTRQHIGKLWREMIWLRFYAAFLAWLILYFIFNNTNAMDPRLDAGESSLSEGSVSMIQLTAYIYCFLSIIISGITMLRAKNYEACFDQINKAILWLTAVESIVMILGYPFGLFGMMLDGFYRAMGLFSHPNPFAHHMGVLVVYMLGLYGYYQGDRKNRIPQWLLMGSFILNMITFLMGLSKTAISAFLLCSLILFLFNLAIKEVRQGFIKVVVVIALLAPIGMVAFQAISGQSFVSLLESRIEKTESLNWRTQIWQDLLSEMDTPSMLIGHGFTAANETVFRMTFNDSQNANPLMMVHNAYIALIYDLGIFGYLMFASCFALLWQAFSCWLRIMIPSVKAAMALLIALTIYFLFVCGFDEMSYMFDAPMIYWSLASLVFCLAIRECQSARQRLREKNALPAGVFWA